MYGINKNPGNESLKQQLSKEGKKAMKSSVYFNYLNSLWSIYALGKTQTFYLSVLGKRAIKTSEKKKV